MDKETPNPQRSMPRSFVAFLSLVIGSAAIVLLLLPFGYNFTDTWLYSVVYLAYFLLLVLTVYICRKWWLRRKDEQAFPFGYAAAFVSASIGSSLYFFGDLFTWPELNRLLAIIFMYFGALCAVYAEPKLNAYTIVATIYIALTLSMSWAFISPRSFFIYFGSVLFIGS